jgi:hypothetical protein
LHLDDLSFTLHDGFLTEEAVNYASSNYSISTRGNSSGLALLVSPWMKSTGADLIFISEISALSMDWRLKGVCVKMPTMTPPDIRIRLGDPNQEDERRVIADRPCLLFADTFHFNARPMDPGPRRGPRSRPSARSFRLILFQGCNLLQYLLGLRPFPIRKEFLPV